MHQLPVAAVLLCACRQHPNPAFRLYPARSVLQAGRRRVLLQEAEGELSARPLLLHVILRRCCRGSTSQAAAHLFLTLPQNSAALPCPSLAFRPCSRPGRRRDQGLQRMLPQLCNR